ncbi:hypothetical protein KZ813_19045 [Sphingomonas sp. RHCKR7]|uniref:hypothetical protein n=1 Tax=Sphingomonas folli TaxID=2862497 RepID=UPI001CA47E34|nr:hypothetical protein [Sphingomonas folli]MBW6528942.1 hypothetical protein [Sphingomonas folli]
MVAEIGDGMIGKGVMRLEHLRDIAPAAGARGSVTSTDVAAETGARDHRAAATREGGL